MEVNKNAWAHTPVETTQTTTPEYSYQLHHQLPNKYNE